MVALATVAAVAAFAATGAAVGPFASSASAASSPAWMTTPPWLPPVYIPGGCPAWACGNNHNEVIVTTATWGD